MPLKLIKINIGCVAAITIFPPSTKTRLYSTRVYSEWIYNYCYCLWRTAIGNFWTRTASVRKYETKNWRGRRPANVSKTWFRLSGRLCKWRLIRGFWDCQYIVIAILIDVWIFIQSIPYNYCGKSVDDTFCKTLIAIRNETRPTPSHARERSDESSQSANKTVRLTHYSSNVCD